MALHTNVVWPEGQTAFLQKSSSKVETELASFRRLCDNVRMSYGRDSRRKDERVDVRVDSETKRLLDELADLYQSNRSHIVRLAVAELARQQGISLSTKPSSREDTTP